VENRTLYGIDDGLVMNENVGTWSADKYRIFQLYAHFFTKGMKGKWGALVYLDLYAGAGLSRMKSTGEILLGSPLIALALDNKFDHYIFCEADSAKLSALQQRVQAQHKDADVTFLR
jgi:three-Cys-motif partner protein